MMNKKRTKEIGRTKYLLFIPLATLLMIFSNIEHSGTNYEKHCQRSDTKRREQD